MARMPSAKRGTPLIGSITRCADTRSGSPGRGIQTPPPPISVYQTELARFVPGSTLSGTATTSSGTVIALDGTVSASSITIVMPAAGGTLATGTRSGANVSGTWNNGVGGSGSWTGAQCN